MAELHTEEQPTSRRALLVAAEELFAKRGYDGVSTRDIAEAAGVNLGAIQYHFGSKANLFIATVHKLMQGCADLGAELECSQSECTPQIAAEKLALFVRSMLERILRPTAPLGASLVCREILSDLSQRDPQMFKSLVVSMVEHFTKPMHDKLLAIFRALQPKLDHDALSSAVGSLVGQCTFYVTHRPFIEELQRRDLSQGKNFEQLIRHITEFTLRGLGCAEALIATLKFETKKG